MVKIMHGKKVFKKLFTIVIYICEYGVWQKGVQETI